MYDFLAKNYSSIFPLESDKLNFIISYCNKKNMRILDIGCATGDLAIELAKKGLSVSGIDINKNMIEIAKEKIINNNVDINFDVVNMMNLNDREKYDCVLCLGNTLPHIPSWEELNRFIELLYMILNYNGNFVFQILNYDKVLSDGKIDFDIIEGADYIFRRKYTKIDDDEIIFEINFYDKKLKKECVDSTKLLPIIKNKVLNCLINNGFFEVECFSDYKMNKSSFDDFYNVYVVKRI